MQILNLSIIGELEDRKSLGYGFVCIRNLAIKVISLKKSVIPDKPTTLPSPLVSN